MLTEQDNLTPLFSEMNAFFASPLTGDFSLSDGSLVVDQVSTHSEAAHDFCGYPRGEQADLGAIEFSTTYEEAACAAVVQAMYDRIP